MHIKALEKKHLITPNKINPSSKRIIEITIIFNSTAMKRDQKKYDTSQEVFYKVCETAWDLCANHLADFKEFSGSYTPARINNAMEVVKRAKKMCPASYTLDNIKHIRINMIKAARQVQHHWQILKQYITAAYSKELAEIELRAAGASYYKKASLDNWSSLRSLINSAQKFMRKELDALTANQNMPPAFPAKFAAIADKFLQISKAFFNAKIKKAQITSRKIEANNIAYDQLINMLKDAQQIFRYQPEIKEQFVFSNIVSIYENKNTSRNHIAASDKTSALYTNNLSGIPMNAEPELADRKNVA